MNFENEKIAFIGDELFSVMINDILTSFGGKNVYNYKFDNYRYLYYISNNNIIRRRRSLKTYKIYPANYWLRFYHVTGTQCNILQNVVNRWF